jgi:hypothetical protein
MKYLAIIISCCWVVTLNAQTNLKLQNGTNIKITGDVDLVFYNTKFTNNGTFIANDGTVSITGNATQENAAIEGTSETDFFNLTINKSSNDAEINQNISVQNSITLINGNLELNNHNLTLNGNYTLHNSHYFLTSGTGSLKREITNGATKVFPIGNGTYTPMTIQNDGTADVFSVRCTPEVLENGISGNAITTNVVDRTWFIEEAVAGGSDLTLTAQWNASDELTSFDRTQCYISHYTGSGWNGNVPSAAVGSDPYSLSRSSITSLSPFAVGSSGALPIELIDFYAFREGENVKLEWTTATEINSDVFEIEHSNDGISFQKIGEVRAATFSNSALNYDFLHQNPVDGINYYRLKMRDLDGSFEYSDIRSVDLTNFQNLSNLVTIYPNPTSDILNIRFSDNFEEGSVEMYNELGKKVLERSLNHPSKNTISVQNLPAGIYLINLKIEGRNLTNRVVIH